jgi:voltage-dependent potassium channel beta subunit
MEYRNLGKSGLKVSELSFGSWITFGSQLDMDGVRNCMKAAIDAGVNFFDNAEAYGSGLAELIMGEILREYKRDELVLSTKIFWGGMKPNMTGLSWKHLVEGTKNSLRRLQLSYVDLLFCHRPDPSTPLEETVRAMDYLVKSGFVFYWGTSEWSAPDIEKAHQIAKENHLVAPHMEQPQYNLFHRDRVEHEYLPLYQKFGMGVTSWSPLDFGILTGKYNQEIPQGSRLALHPDLKSHLTDDKLAIVKKLMAIADDIGCTLAQLSIAWCLKNHHVSSVILGASSPKQVVENLEASFIKQQLTDDVMKKIIDVTVFQKDIV